MSDLREQNARLAQALGVAHERIAELERELDDLLADFLTVRNRLKEIAPCADPSTEQPQ